MKEFTYTITDPQGIHARPAGLAVKEAKKFESKITIEKGSKKGDLKKIFTVMALGVKQGEEIKVTVDTVFLWNKARGPIVMPEKTDFPFTTSMNTSFRSFL